MNVCASRDDGDVNKKQTQLQFRTFYSWSRPGVSRVAPGDTGSAPNDIRGRAESTLIRLCFDYAAFRGREMLNSVARFAPK